MPIPDEFKVEDYLVDFPDTYYEGPWIDAPIVVKQYKVGQYLGSVLKTTSRCLQVDADIPALIGALAAVDYMAGFHAGRETKRIDYVTFMNEYFPARYGPFIDRIYSDLRCGLVHNLVAVNPWRPSSGSFLLVSDSSNHLAVEGERVVWSIRAFVEHAYQAWVAYCHALIMKHDAQMVGRFNSRFDRLAGCGAFMEKVPD